jgi:D-glycero-alpha-D-manno-heptose-7-phosphate kinase
VLIVRSPVRVSFGGGGTDLPAYYERFGGAVLSVTIDKYFYTIVNGRSDGRLHVISSYSRALDTPRNVAAMNVRGSDLETLVTILKEISCDFSADVFVASEIPFGAGLGFSTCACVGILKAFTVYLNQPLTKFQLAEQAFHITRHALGHRVGRQDAFAVAFGGLNHIAIRRGGQTEVSPIDLEPSVLHQLQSSLMLFFTGPAEHSRTILEEQESLTRVGAGRALDLLNNMRSLTDRMLASLKSGDLDCFGALLDENWQCKRRISSKISNPRIDHLYSTALQNGALGGKITGAGGGGSLLLYCAQHHQGKVREALKAEGIREVPFNFDHEGAQVFINESFTDLNETKKIRQAPQVMSKAG